MRKPEKIVSTNFYMKTLSISSWIAVICTISIIFICLWSMFYLCTDPLKYKSWKSLGECLLFISRSITNRGNNILIKFISFTVQTLKFWKISCIPTFLQDRYFSFIYMYLKIKGMTKSPKRTSFRIFYLTATLFGFILLLFYSALFTSKLLTTVVDSPIKSLEDILELRTHQLCVLKNSFAIKSLFSDVWIHDLFFPNIKVQKYTHINSFRKKLNYNGKI